MSGCQNEGWKKTNLPGPMVDKSEFPFWFSQSNGTNPLPQIGSEVQWNGTTNVMKFVQSWNVAHRATQQWGITQFFTIMANIHPSQHLWCIWILAREAALKLVRRQAVDWERHSWYFERLLQSKHNEGKVTTAPISQSVSDLRFCAAKRHQ